MIWNFCSKKLQTTPVVFVTSAYWAIPLAQINFLTLRKTRKITKDIGKIDNKYFYIKKLLHLMHK